MVGYKDPQHINIGWFSARLDSLANYIPARLTAILMVLAAWLSHENWKSAWKILRRDKNKTESVNAGWPMSTMAGALTVQLEKTGSYVLGEKNEILSPEHVPRALHIMKLTAFLFVIVVVISFLILSWLL
jgi:adenosylcobinamide-phosphate synthase